METIFVFEDSQWHIVAWHYPYTVKLAASSSSYVPLIAHRIQVDLSPSSEFAPAESLLNSMQPSERIKSPTPSLPLLYIQVALAIDVMLPAGNTQSVQNVINIIFVYFLSEIEDHTPNAWEVLGILICMCSVTHP